MYFTRTIRWPVGDVAEQSIDFGSCDMLVEHPVL